MLAKFLIGVQAQKLKKNLNKQVRADSNLDDKYYFIDLSYQCVCALGDSWQVRLLTNERGASLLLSSPKTSTSLGAKKLSE